MDKLNKSHRYLQQECYRIYSQQGYKVELEKQLPNKRRADLWLEKDGETIIIECFVRPTLNITKDKIESYEGFANEIIIAYPSSFTPNFPVEIYGTKLPIDVPDILNQKTSTVLIPKILRNSLSLIKDKLDMTHLYQVIQLLINNANWEKFEEEVKNFKLLNAEEQTKEAVGNQPDALDN